MKWLILILLISCGKHESPPSIDLADDDGDQILNHQEESEIQKYIANFEALGEVNGVIKIHHSQPIEIKFSNNANNKEKALTLITAKKDNFQQRDYFSEWNDLNLKETSDSYSLNETVYTLHLEFESMPVKPEELYLIEGNERILLGKWDQSMKISLSAHRVRNILNGKANLSLKKNLPQIFKDYMSPDQSIREKTYRVYLFDGSTSYVYYVARTLPFENFKKLNNIAQAKPYSEEEIFFNDDNVISPIWYERTLHNEDHVIVNAVPTQLKATLLQRFNFNKSTIQRNNGIPNEPLVFNNSAGSVYLRVKGKKTTRIFKESEHRKKYQYFRQGKNSLSIMCLHHIREINSEFEVPVTIHELMSELILTEAELERVEEFSTHEGVIWEMKLQAQSPEITVNLRPQHKDSYVITGEYGPLCLRNGKPLIFMPPQETSSEGNLTFEIESYVEKN